jgi:hypothetical protein
VVRVEIETITGATNPKGGAFTSFSLLLQRGDDQQRIEALQFKAPAGLLGMISTDLREVDAVIERPEFMFNPTHCEPASFSGTASGTPPPGAGGAGATAAISTSFDVVGCKGLAFAPRFAVSTSGKTSKADGASLTADLSYPNVAQGTDADIAKVKVELPKALPSPRRQARSRPAVRA